MTTQGTTPALHTIDLPTRFYDDHVARDLPAGQVVKHLARTTRVALTDDDLLEVLSDAEHYASLTPWDFNEAGLVASAAATARRITTYLEAST